MLRALARILVRNVPWLGLCVAISPMACGEIRVLAVTSSASFVAGLPAPGSLATVFCTGLTGADVRISFAEGSPAPLDAPVLAVADFGSYQQVNFQVPWEAGSRPGRGILWQLSQGSPGAEIPQVAASWGQFFTDAEGFVIAQHVSNYRLVTRADPALPGEWIVAYGSNFGAVVRPPPTGAAAPLDRLSPLDPGGNFPWQYGVLVQGSFTVSNFIGLAPGTTGVYQINFKMPAAIPSADAFLSVFRARNCGFFFVQGCGRGFPMEFSTAAKLRVQ